MKILLANFIRSLIYTQIKYSSPGFKTLKFIARLIKKY